MENIINPVTAPATENKMLELFKKRFGDKDNAKVVLDPAEAQKEKALAESKKRNIFKLGMTLSKLGININEDEKKNLEDFFTSEEILEKSFGPIFFLPSAHQYLRMGLHAEDLQIKGENGIYAIIRTDMNDQRVCNLCYPALDVRLRTREFTPKLKVALEDWIIELKSLQVQGNRVNTDLSDRGLEIDSDKEYLRMVIRKMMASEAIAKITNAIGQSAVYTEIQVNAVMYGTDANGNRIKSCLFSMEPMEYTQKMGANSIANHRFDMLQGDVEVLDLAIKNGDVLEDCRVACIDPEQPSLYLHKGKRGYHVNLYIPEEMMQEFLNVTD